MEFTVTYANRVKTTYTGKADSYKVHPESGVLELWVTERDTETHQYYSPVAWLGVAEEVKELTDAEIQVF